MNIKLKAGLITAGFAVWCATVTISLKFLSQYVTLQQFSFGLIGLGLALCFYTFYSLILSKLEFDARLERLVDKK